jgi:hypothetical protein
MLPALLGSAAGAAAVTIGRGAAAALGNSLSFAAELAKAAGNPVVAPDSAAKDEGGLPVELSQRISDLTGRIRRHLAAAGEKLAQPVELISNGLGGIAVAGDHPQQAAIEQALGNDVLLEQDFHRLASDYRNFVMQCNDAKLPAALTVVVA